MGKGRFVNHKLGKVVHRAINQHLWRTKTRDWKEVTGNLSIHSRKDVRSTEDEQKDESKNEG
jgi:hypothetical protein